MNTPIIKIGDVSYYVNIKKESLINLNDKNDMIKFSELEPETRSILNMFYVFS